jgi:NTE family protein
MYAELRRAEYRPSDVLRFVNVLRGRTRSDGFAPLTSTGRDIDAAGGSAPRRIVLALGGGAARAVSHAAVIEALTEAGFEIAGISGCSAGAIVGAMIVRGMTPAQVAERFADFRSTSIYRGMARAYVQFAREERPKANSRTRYLAATAAAFYSEATLAGVPSSLLLEFVEYFVGPDCDMAQLDRPFSCVATDLVEGRPVVLSHGSLHAALAASCCVPGLFPPQELGGHMFVDGSIVTEVPVWAAQLLGAGTPVLAVHMGRPYHRIASYETSAEVVMRCSALVHAELVREQLRQTPHLITVPMEDVGWLDFRNAHRIVERGRDAARQLIPQLHVAVPAAAAR